MYIEFWFEFASTYSYLSAARIEATAEAMGLEVRWRPFLLGPIFKAQGWNDSPFNIYPAKGRYMWRDMERLCEGFGLPFRVPSSFPRNGLLAARIACLFQDEAWMPSFAKSVYAANFSLDRDIADPEVLTGILEAVGEDGEARVRAAKEDAAKAKLRRQTEEAEAHGIFGAPSFRVGDELFWGNDRMGDALAQARLGGR